MGSKEQRAVWDCLPCYACKSHGPTLFEKLKVYAFVQLGMEEEAQLEVMMAQVIESPCLSLLLVPCNLCCYFVDSDNLRLSQEGGG